MTESQRTPQEELLAVVLDPLGGYPGTRAAALLDASGRILAQRGFRDRGHAMSVGSLAAALRASGRRIGELLGDTGILRLQGEGGARTLLLTELPGLKHPLILLVVADPQPEQIAFRNAMQGVARRLGNLTVSEGVQSADAFESSLMSSLDRLFGSDGAGEEV